ncbi:MAG: sigma 54-interacting transcriptional regulator [Candidatus Hydrogenedentes bacterium]|nr:sigma 54-interacting transcriptional regulator [Candidatus Hydrogenedentota bacterium]
MTCAGNRYCLRMTAGPMPGRSWSLTEPLTLVGRSMGCHIRVDDSHISRVQCEIAREGSSVRLRTISERNPTMVNGNACNNAVLTPGDVISFCGISLVIDQNPAADTAMAPSAMDTRTTQSLDDIVHLQSSFDANRYTHDATLVEDLHSLVGIVRALGKATSLDALIAQLVNHLTDRFRAESVWIGLRMQADGVLILLPPVTAEETRTAPFGVMREACAMSVGLMIEEAADMEGRWLIAAPLLHGGESIGALVVGHPRSLGEFTPADLQYLVAVADCCAPLVRAAERFEQMQRDMHAKSEEPCTSVQLLGDSREMRALQGEIRRAAAARAHVILQGETGVGKELAARMLHDHSARCSGPYIVVNCAAIAPELFESDIFGHERGAFTGAIRRRKGLFELAQGGTLFLDEITELSLANQAHLLRAVETGTFRPVGAERELKVDVRVVCATNRPLPDPEQRYFRNDLFHRLAGIVLRIKPLRERRDDIRVLAAHFLRTAALHSANHPTGFTEAALEKLAAYAWPGNVRELRNVVERACDLSRGRYVNAENILVEDATPIEPIHRENATLEDLERQHLVAMLQRHNNRVLDVARALGISRSTLYYRLSRHGIKARQPK